MTYNPWHHHHRQRNPRGWRWRLVMMITGGEIEVAPLLPAREIHSHERLIVRLGIEGALNTVEVLSMAPETTELVPMSDWQKDPQPNTLIAVDVDQGMRLVGWFLGWEGIGEDRQMIVELVNGAKEFRINIGRIVKAYWAPAGYRP